MSGFMVEILGDHRADRTARATILSSEETLFKCPARIYDGSFSRIRESCGRSASPENQRRRVPKSCVMDGNDFQCESEALPDQVTSRQNSFHCCSLL
jgi:hypothetical protein